MMLEKGTLCIVGGKYADQLSYQRLVGQRVRVRNKFEGRLPGSPPQYWVTWRSSEDTWHVATEDLHPLETNEVARHLLRQDY